MATTSKNKSILVTDYDKTAEVARLLSVYGCYSNVDFDDPELREKINNSLINSQAAFRKERKSVDVILENYVEKTKNMDSKQQYYISPDRFDEEVVSLVRIYRLCTLKSMENTVIEYINYLYNIAYPEDAIEVANRKKLEEYFGKDTKRDSLFFLEIGKGKLSPEELFQLYSALAFFNGKAPYSVPGYMACDRINDYLKLSERKTAANEANIIFSYNNIDRILNDNAVYSIFEAIKQEKWISFNFRNIEIETLKKMSESEKANNKKVFCGKRKYCCPLKVMYEFQNGRGYLVGWDSDYKKIRYYRLDDIFNVEPEDKFDGDMNRKKAGELFKAKEEQIWLSESTENAKNVVIDFDESAENIKKMIPIGTVISISENSCRFEASIMNFKDIVPFIRRFGEKARVSKEKSPELYEYIKNDLRRSLEKYEAF